MKVYQLVFKLLSMPWSAQVYVVYRGETMPIRPPYLSKSGKVVILKDEAEFIADADNMPPVKPGKIVRL